jgi:hypothetical protein
VLLNPAQRTIIGALLRSFGLDTPPRHADETSACRNEKPIPDIIIGVSFWSADFSWALQNIAGA